MRDVSQRQQASAATPDEAALLAAFRGGADGARRYILRTAQAIAKDFPRQRPALTLVHAGGASARKGERNAKS